MKSKTPVQTQPTPTPWSVNPAGGISGDGENVICNSVETLTKFGGQPVNNGFFRAQANVELIVKAVNQHEYLIAVERAAQSLVHDYYHGANAMQRDADFAALNYALKRIESIQREDEVQPSRLWWKAPEDGEEYHTPKVWSQIAKAAHAAGDMIRAAEANEAAERETRTCGAE